MILTFLEASKTGFLTLRPVLHPKIVNVSVHVTYTSGDTGLILCPRLHLLSIFSVGEQLRNVPDVLADLSLGKAPTTGFLTSRPPSVQLDCYFQFITGLEIFQRKIGNIFLHIIFSICFG